MNVQTVFESGQVRRRAVAPLAAALGLGALLSVILGLLYPGTTGLLRLSLRLMGLGGGFFLTALAVSAFSVRPAGRLLIVGQALVMAAIGLALLN